MSNPKTKPPEKTAYEPDGTAKKKNYPKPKAKKG